MDDRAIVVAGARVSGVPNRSVNQGQDTGEGSALAGFSWPGGLKSASVDCCVRLAACNSDKRDGTESARGRERRERLIQSGSKLLHSGDSGLAPKAACTYRCLSRTFFTSLPAGPNPSGTRYSLPRTIFSWKQLDCFCRTGNTRTRMNEMDQRVF
jgi:hypothetical protein